MVTSVLAVRRMWLNSANFEHRPKAFVRIRFRWGVQLGFDCLVARGWKGKGCLEIAPDLLTDVDVMAPIGLNKPTLNPNATVCLPDLRTLSAKSSLNLKAPSPLAGGVSAKTSPRENVH